MLPHVNLFNIFLSDISNFISFLISANEEKKKSERSLLEYVNDSCESECTFLAQTIDVEESDHQEVQKFCFEAIERIIDLIQSPSAQVSFYL